jgi:adenosylhomocysteinase
MRIRQPLGHLQVEQFFTSVLDQLSIDYGLAQTRQRDGDRRIVNPAVQCLIVTHLLEDRPFFLKALSDIVDIPVILAKPKSIDEEARTALKNDYKISTAKRTKLAGTVGADYVCRASEPDKSVILLDIGGYFASAIGPLRKRLGTRFLGVVEDTENGQQLYERESSVDVPIFSVARSPLKETEDYLVGQAVLHSAEHLARSAGHIFTGRRAAVIGFGKIGRSIADGLRRDGVIVAVIDTDPIAQVRAKSLGYDVGTKEELLSRSDIVVGATGNLSLSDSDYGKLKNGSFLFTVTSSDSELAKRPSVFISKRVSSNVDLVQTPGKYFYLFNEGNAVNFLHGAVVGDFIYLVQAEILAAVMDIVSSHGRGQSKSGIREVSQRTRRTIANAWMEFLGSTGPKS